MPTFHIKPAARSLKMVTAQRLSKILCGSVGIILASNADATCSGSARTFTCTAGSTVAQVQTAVNNALDEAVVNFEAGSYSWGSRIMLTNRKGITLRGAGADQTIVDVTAGPVILMDSLSGDNVKSYRITGFTFRNAPRQIVTWLYGPGSIYKLRIDHNNFSHFAP